jgi:hypothetical protein
LAADGVDLVLQQACTATAHYPTGFHVGFILENLDAVQATYERLKRASVEVTDAISHSIRGAQFFAEIENIQVEVACHFPLQRS